MVSISKFLTFSGPARHPFLPVSGDMDSWDFFGKIARRIPLWSGTETAGSDLGLPAKPCSTQQGGPYGILMTSISHMYVYIYIYNYI